MQETESAEAAAAAAEAAEDKRFTSEMQRFTAAMKRHSADKEAFQAQWKVFVDALMLNASSAILALLPHYYTRDPVSCTVLCAMYVLPYEL